MVSMYGIEEMEEYGGGFVKALANAWNKADPVNKRKLELNFEFFDQYEKAAQRRKERETNE